MSWRNSLLKPFVPGIARKTIVADPDELFRDEKIFRSITDRGFTLIFFEESISFRFLYESELREAWDRGENREVVVVVRPDIREVEKLPADLLRALLQRHYRKQQVPTSLDDYLLSVLGKIGRFVDWPLRAIVPDRNAFLVFSRNAGQCLSIQHLAENGRKIR